MKQRGKSIYIKLDSDSEPNTSIKSKHSLNDDKKFNLTEAEQERVTLPIYYYKYNKFIGKLDLKNVYPNVKKYARTSKHQKMDKSRLLIGLSQTLDVLFTCLYLPWDITLRFLLEDCGFDTSYYYYIDRYLLTDNELNMTIQELYNRNILHVGTYIIGYKKKRFFTVRDVKKIIKNEFSVIKEGYM